MSSAKNGFFVALFVFGVVAVGGSEVVKGHLYVQYWDGNACQSFAPCSSPCSCCGIFLDQIQPGVTFAVSHPDFDYAYVWSIDDGDPADIAFIDSCSRACAHRTMRLRLRTPFSSECWHESAPGAHNVGRMDLTSLTCAWVERIWITGDFGYLRVGGDPDNCPDLGDNSDMADTMDFTQIGGKILDDPWEPVDWELRRPTDFLIVYGTYDGITVEDGARIVFTETVDGNWIRLYGTCAGTLRFDQSVIGSGKMHIYGLTGTLDVAEDFESGLQIRNHATPVPVEGNLAGLFLVGGDLSGDVLIQNDLSGKIDVAGIISGDIEVRGVITSTGAIDPPSLISGGIEVRGDIEGTIESGGDISGTIQAGGDVANTGAIVASGSLGVGGVVEIDGALGTSGRMEFASIAGTIMIGTQWLGTIEVDGSILPPGCYHNDPAIGGGSILVGDTGDCNTNGISDGCDILDGTSRDCNDTGVPDECEAITLGDFNADTRVDLVDFRAFATFMAGPGEELLATPDCIDAVLAAFDFDSDCDADLKDFGAFQNAFTGP